MNVTDVSDDQIPNPTGYDRLDLMFARQRQLMVRYKNIERRNSANYPDDYPVDLHSRPGQAILRDMAWRVVEELAESAEASREHPDTPHAIEELSDALHFLIELTLLAGLPYNKLISHPDDMPGHDMLDKYWGLNLAVNDFAWHYWGVTENLGCAMNCLRNKAWKDTHVLTDVEKFHVWLRRTWLAFMSLAHAHELDPDGLYRIYFKKAEVNAWRQKTKY